MTEFLNAVEQRRAMVTVPSTQASTNSAGVNAEIVRLTWDKVLYVVNKDPKVWEQNCSLLFAAMDRDGSGEIDIEE